LAGTVPAGPLAATSCPRHLCGFGCDFVAALGFSVGCGFLSEIGCDPYFSQVGIETSVFLVIVEEANGPSEIDCSFRSQNANVEAVSSSVVDS